MAYFTKTIRGAIVGAVALVAFAPVAAFAASPDDGTAATVAYSDLNLTTPGGAAKLHARVARAARAVCQYDAGTRELWQVRAQNACVARALASAQVQVAAAISGSNLGTSFALREEPVRH